MAAPYALKVAYGRETIEVSVAPDTSVKTLKDLVAERCSALARNMRLIAKGKTLADKDTVAAAGLSDGAKLMMLAGGAPVVSAVCKRSRGECTPLFADAPGAQGTAALSAARGARAPAVAAPAPLAPGGTAARHAAWSATGLVTLRDAGLTEVPGEVWAVGGVARCLDLCGNPRLGGVGPQVAALGNLTRLHLSGCGLVDAAVAWDAVCSLSRLQNLVLDQNALTRLPDALGALAALTRLSVAQNALVELPASLCSLASLQTLDVSGNALAALPQDLGSCSALEELVLTSNRVTALPASLAKCLALKVLSADTNHISCAGVPSELLRGCGALTTLSLHGNPCTIEELREIDGYAELDARRRAKADKVLQGRVLGAASAFDEGADAARNRKF